MRKAVVGIDLALVSLHKAVIFTEKPSKEERGHIIKFPHNIDGFEKVLGFISNLGCKPHESTFLMEPTGKLWMTLSAFLKARGAEVISIKPSLSKEFRKVISRHAKSDKIDATAPGKIFFALPEILYPVHLAEPCFHHLKNLCDMRINLVREATAQKTRIGEHIRSVYPGIMEKIKPAALLAGPIKEFMKKYLDPEKALKLGPKRFARFLKTRSRKQWKEKDINFLYDQIILSEKLFQELSRCNFCPFDLEALQKILNRNIDWLEDIEARIHSIEKEISEVYGRCDPNKILENIPGIGKTLAPSICSILGPMDRFQNLKSLKGYSGMVPRSSQSSKKIVLGLRITKTSNKRLKRDLVLAARTAILWDAELAAYAVKKLRQGKHYNMVCVAIAGKLLARIRCLLKKDARDATYQFRDKNGRPIDKKASRILALKTWRDYKMKDGNCPQSFMAEAAQN